MDDTPIITNGGIVTLDRDAEVASLAIAYAGPLIDPVLGIGSGTLDHTDGRLNICAGRMIIGRDAASFGRYNASGFAWLDARRTVVDVGSRGAGLMHISNGATVQVSGVRAPGNAGPYATEREYGSIGIEGVGTRFRVASIDSKTDPSVGLLELGRHGRASFDVSGGALAEANRIELWATVSPGGSDFKVEGSGTLLRTIRGGPHSGELIAGIPSEFPSTSPLPSRSTICVGIGSRIEAERIAVHHTMIRGGGTIHARTLDLFPGSRIEPAGDDSVHDHTGTLTIDAAVRVACDGDDCIPDPWFADRPLPEPVLVIDIEGPDDHDRLAVAGGSIDIALEVYLGYQPDLGQVFEILAYAFDSAEQGRYTRVIAGGALSRGVVLRPRYTFLGSELVATHPADVNMDGSVTLNDIDAFVANFLSSSRDFDPVLADINQDGELNFDDIDLFVEAYLSPD